MSAPVRPGALLTFEQVAFLISRRYAWPDARVPVAIAFGESGDQLTRLCDTNAYRDHSQNPLGGNDRGLVQINSKAWPNVSDATCYNPITAIDFMWTASKNGTDFGPWNYGVNAYGPKANPPKPARTLDLAQAGASIAAATNPYWTLFDANLDVTSYPALLPRPQGTPYLSALPPAMRYGASGGTSVPKGQVAALISQLNAEGLYPAPAWDYYNASVRDNVAIMQDRLVELGVLDPAEATGTNRGQYSDKTRKAWDGIRRYVHMKLGR